VAEAGRVIAGSARAIRLAAPGPGTRPFGDRVKQTLFAILEPDLRGARFLDLFAGSGAAGIEALSRGAASADFVERDATAVRTIEANLRATKLAGERARVVRREAIAWLESQPPDAPPWDVVVIDPPYAEERLLVRALDLLANRPGLVAPSGRVVAKHFHGTSLPATIGLLASERERRFGETTLTFYRLAPDEPPAEDEA
jgi:16S rRNA (guanine(966)-N(2))-methyltransferase RsmD